MNYLLRNASENDFEFVKNIHHQTLREYVEPIWGWNENFQDEQVKKNFIPEKFQIIQIELIDIGVLVIEERDNEIFLASISIASDYQRKGLGKKIILDVIQKAKQKNLPVTLSVLKTNRLAKKLYKSLGFYTVKEEKVRFHMKHPLKTTD